MVNGIETYRFLHQQLFNGAPFSVAYETTFPTALAAKDFFLDYKRELLKGTKIE
jgi:hypothetical protein